MKLISIVSLLISFISVSVQADQVGDIRFIAKVLSFDQNKIQIESAGNKFEVPRSTVKVGKLEAGQEREIAMSKDDFNHMKALRLYKESEKAAKQKK